MLKHQDINQQEDSERKFMWMNLKGCNGEAASDKPSSYLVTPTVQPAVVVTATAIIPAPQHPLPLQMRNETKIAAKKIY